MSTVEASHFPCMDLILGFSDTLNDAKTRPEVRTSDWTGLHVNYEPGPCIEVTHLWNWLGLSPRSIPGPRNRSILQRSHGYS